MCVASTTPAIRRQGLRVAASPAPVRADRQSDARPALARDEARLASVQQRAASARPRVPRALLDCAPVVSLQEFDQDMDKESMGRVARDYFIVGESRIVELRVSTPVIE